jgi:capsular exopolysaccharide synthesis family protein
MSTGPTTEFQRAARSGEPPPASYRQPDIGMIGLNEGIALLRRRFRLIATVVTVSTILAAIVSFNLTKIYAANATIVLERTETRPYDMVEREVRDRSATETEMDIIESREVAGRVVDALHLVDDSRFNTYLQRPGVAARDEMQVQAWLYDYFSWLPEPVLDLLSLAPPSPDGPLPSFAMQRDRAISSLLPQLTVSRTGESLAMSVRVANTDPNLAATLANAVATNYVAYSLELKRGPAERDVTTLPDIASQSFLMSLRSEEARLLRERAQLASLFDKNHPKILNADAAIASARKMIDDEMSRIALERSSQAQKPSARVVSEAEVPTSPSFPKPNVIVAGGFVGSFVLAILLALLIEGADKRIRTGDRTAKILGVPNLAYVPQIPKGRGWRSQKPYKYMQTHTHSAFAEAMRSLYLACRVSNTDRPHQVIMLTSSLPDEGKTSLAFGLAITASADGRRTVLVDLDLHKGGVRRALGGNYAGPSLQNFFRGECTLADVVEGSPDVPGLDIIATSTQPAKDARLSSSRLREMIQALRAEYDVIILDTPPILIVDDANWLAPIVDAVLLIVRWDKTKEDTLAEAAGRLRINCAPIVGTVINRVDPKVQLRHGYGGTPQYYREARKYVTN